MSKASSPFENRQWAEDEGFEFELWTDGDNTLSEYYGTDAGLFNDRVTQILGPDGTQVLLYADVNSSIAIHPAQVLTDCQILFGE